MSGHWRVWCPVCCVLRDTRIPAHAPSAVVVREYDEHLRQRHGQEKTA